MKAAHYRSYENYVCRMRELHERAGHHWSRQHELEARHGIRSGTRGMGPPRQSGPLPAESLCGISNEAVQVAGGPVGFVDVCVLGMGFLLREAEIAYARRAHMHLCTETSVVRLELPTSKTDVTAIGCSRSWGCICSASASPLCVFHSAQRHLLLIDGLFGHMDDGEFQRPLFPGLDGRTCAKDGVVKAIDAVAEHMGLPLLDQQGARIYGGHSLRVGGAQWLGRLGVPVPLVQSLARWESNIVLRYLKDTHLEALTGTVVRLLEGAVSGQDYKSTRSSDQNQAAVDEEMQGDLEDIKLELEKLSKTLGRRFRPSAS